MLNADKNSANITEAKFELNAQENAKDSEKSPKNQNAPKSIDGSLNSSINSVNIARKMAKNVQKEMLRAKALEILRFGDGVMMTKWEKQLNKEVILNSRKEFNEVVIDRGILKVANLSKYRTLDQTRHEKYL